MNEQSTDLSLETLLSMRAAIAPQISEHLLEQCYALQKKYQFDRDRTLSSTAMERLIDAAVAETSQSNG